MTSLLENLNNEQLEAVKTSSAASLILAGAGSGKTRVLTTRIAWLIDTQQTSPHGILAVTFTNKAAQEMIFRISNILPINTRGMWIGTFHGLCNRLLRQHHKEVGLPQSFQILDSADQLSVIKRVQKKHNVDLEKYPPKQIQYHINSAKDLGLRYHQIEETDDFSHEINKIYGKYQELCDKEGVVDFGELLLRCYELLKLNQVLRKHYQTRFKHILVDEFQDTNQLQYNLLRLLHNNKSSIFAVGDDDQSIYGFRGARSNNLKDYVNDFQVSETIKLEQNYRSHGHILDAANALIQNNINRLGKNLWTSDGKGNQIKLLEADSDQNEANFIINEIKTLEADDYSLDNVAIFYRSNAQSRTLEHALFGAGLPYRVYGGLRFFERQEIKHALAYLRLAMSHDDDGAFLRIINFPSRGIGQKSVEKINEIAIQNNVALYTACRDTKLTGKAEISLERFISLIDKLRSLCITKSLSEVIEFTINVSGLIEYYNNEKDGIDRIENLRELVNAGMVFEAENTLTRVDITASDASSKFDSVQDEGNLLPSFLAYASLESGEHQASDGSKALQLMTVHAAKGLEFDTVFLTGLEEGLFPHENSLNDTSGLEEERRLMYVAITRAKKTLFISHAQSRMLHGQTRWNMPSRFLEEIPGENVQKSNVEFTSILPRTSQFEDLPPNGKNKLPNGLRIGLTVEHGKFGVGVIVQAEGQGNDTRVQVNFENFGNKWLVLSFAKLKTIGKN